jgi:iron complex outermembrane receptor protein
MERSASEVKADKNKKGRCLRQTWWWLQGENMRVFVSLSIALALQLPLNAFQTDAAAAEAIEKIVVTASRRAGPADDVPQSIDVIDKRQLNTPSVSRLGDIRHVAPAVQFKSIFGSSAPQLFLRGVGNTDVNPSANPGVAVYIDEIPVSSPLGQGLLLFDLQRVEVLKGPQGTLFGRNATGGALILISEKPGEVMGGSATASFGTDGYRAVEGAFDSGQHGQVRARIAGMARASDGFTKNDLGPNANELDDYAARLIVEADVPEDWTLRLTADFSADRSSMTAHEGRGLFDPAALAASPPGAPLFVPCPASRVLANECVNLLGYRYSADRYAEGFDQPGREYLNSGGVSLTVEHSAAVDFRATTAWRRSMRDVIEDTDASPLSIAELGFMNEHESLTQEFLLIGKTDQIDWRVGAFGLSETLETTNRYNTLETLRLMGVPFIPDPLLFFQGPFRLDQSYVQKINSIAVFGDGDLALTEKLTVTAGLRLTRETTDFTTVTLFREVIADPVLSPVRMGQTEDDEASWRLAATYKVTPNVTGYASLSRGFKSSNFNGGALFPFDALGPVAPERLTAYEAGIRTRLPGATRLDVSAYHYSYEGLQTFTFRPSPPPTRQILDSGDAEIYGLDASFSAELFSGLRTRLSATLLNAEFTDFVDANGVDRSGNPLPNAPDLALAAALFGEVGVGADWMLRYRIDGNHRSKVSFDTTNSPLIGSKAATTYNVQLALVERNDGLSLTLDVVNATDEAVVLETLNIAEYGLIQQTYGAPRQVMLSLSKAF